MDANIAQCPECANRQQICHINLIGDNVHTQYLGLVANTGLSFWLSKTKEECFILSP